MTERPVVVVGGGLAGLAVGVALARRGVPVHVLEQKPAAGGRAYSFTDAVTGETIDNGQHVLIAGYAHTMRFLSAIGTRQLLHEQSFPTLTFHHPDKGFALFRIPPLPPPLHLASAVLAFPLFSPSDRMKLLRAGASIQRCTGEREQAITGMTITAWLDALRQPVEVRRSFWEPLAVSIMNEDVDAASALLFVRALRKAFLGGWRDGAMAIPLVGLSNLYVLPAKEYIQARGGRVQVLADVVGIETAGGLASGVRLRDGSVIEATAVVLAVPARGAATLIPPGAVAESVFNSLKDIPDSPIISIHLWFERGFMTHHAVALIGKRVQWVFDRRWLGPASASDGHVSAVISAAHRFVGLSNEELVRIACEDLSAVYGSVCGSPRHAVVIRERRATFSALPAVEALRPPQATAIPNFFLAGDWTDTGLPATIEGAVVSASRCEELLVAFLSRNLDI